MEQYFLTIATKMLGGSLADKDDLHDSLKADLYNIDSLCKDLGGELVSRQVIACAIVDWCRRNPTLEAYKI